VRTQRATDRWIARTLDLMPGIVNGRAWLSDRRRFLREELAKDPSPEQRAAIAADLAQVDQELSSSQRRWWRALLWGARPPV
jgi:hypothetical protein